MKKTLNLKPVFCLLMALLSVTFFACKKETSKQTGLTGKWLANIPQSQQTSLYEFKANGTYEHTFMVTDSVTRKSLGVISKETGKYQLTDNKLQLYDLVSYLNKDYKYGPVTDLVMTIGRNTSNYNISFNDKADKFSLSYICGPSELCAEVLLPNFYYYKQ